MKLVDLSAPIKSTDPNLPNFLRTTVEFHYHGEGAEQVRQIFGVGSELLRRGEAWQVEDITINTHGATHIDAPRHYNSAIQGEPALAIDELPLEWFKGPGVVVDARDRVDGDPVDAAHFEREFERVGHDLRAGDIVLVWSGRDQFYDQPDYWTRGCGVTAEATIWLCDRGIRVMGIDGWSWDRPLHLQARDALERNAPGIFWAAHQVDRQYCQIERLVNLGSLPPTGFELMCFPLKVEGASAGPTRVVAAVPE